ncbi:ORF6N domain-containing protein [Candidatus Saccharibacteria bacterium]|nr:ORF6N domain-containing protein [Candidatus Saccharibacteria bacterium]
MDKSPNKTISNLAKSSKNTEGYRPAPEIKSLIYNIRGQQVMLDSDLAKLYQCKNGTKTINQAVSRHKERFPEDFCFQLTKQEQQHLLRSQVGTLEKGKGKHSKYLPLVFTEQGIAMLSSVLRTSVAADVNVQIMRAFVSMRRYVNPGFLGQKYYNDMTIRHDSEIKLLQESLDKFEKKRKDEGIYFNGQIYDAYSRILKIFSEAKKSLTIIDGYTDNITLDIIKRLNIPVTIIISKSAPLKSQDIKKYLEQYNNLTIAYDNTFHDRYFILDNKIVYHCGASINRIGYKTFSITKINDVEIITALLDKIDTRIKTGG